MSGYSIQHFVIEFAVPMENFTLYTIIVTKKRECGCQVDAHIACKKKKSTQILSMSVFFLGKKNNKVQSYMEDMVYCASSCYPNEQHGHHL